MAGFDEIAKTPDRLAALAKNGNDKAQVAKLLSELLTMAVRQVFPTVEVSCSPSAFEGGVLPNPIVTNGEVDTPSASDEPEKPVISRLSADPRFQNTIAAFIRKLDKQLLNMEAAYDKGDLEDLAILAHWLKGAGGTVGYDDFTRPATSLFSYAKSDQIEPAGRMLRKIQRLAKSIVPPNMTQDNRTDIN